MPGAPDWYDGIMSGRTAPPAHISLAILDISRLGYKETRDSYDWVPTAVAYDRYCQHITQFTRLPILIREFSWALHLAYPEIEKCRRRRASDGQSFAGWSGLTGPGAERSVDPELWRKRR